MSDRLAPSILSLQQVSLKATIGSQLLLQDISFDISQGSRIGVLGASGAGKTSLLRLLNHLVSPTQGNIYFETGKKQQLSPIELRRRIALVPQEPKMLGMTVMEALKYPLQLQQIPEPEIKQRIATWIELLRIPSEWFNKTELQLSLGQRQLVTITRGLIVQPQILLLDEPTSALDLGTASRMLRVLEDLNQSQKLTVVMVNHQWELIQDFCDRLLFFHNGRLEEDLPANNANWQKLQQILLQTQKEQEEEWG